MYWYTKRMIRRYITLVVFVLLLLPWSAGAQVRTIVFPVAGEASFRNDFRDPRAGGTREHLGIDIFADKMTPIVSAMDGVVAYITRPEARWGYSIAIQDRDGYFYYYYHINNDTPGTDDGQGGEGNAFVGDLRRGSEVRAGQHIAWVGDSGNAESTPPHLHFEIRAPGTRAPINPYESLTTAVESGNIASRVSIDSGTASVFTDPGDGGDVPYVFVIDLREGMEGDAIRELQKRLKDEGFFTYYTTTNYFGPITKLALERYQSANNIAPTGVLSYETRALLNREPGTAGGNILLKEELFEGDSGESVSQVQLKLEALGYGAPTVLGEYDWVTREAVRRFQREQSLLATGYVNQQTWKTLNEVYAASDTRVISEGERNLPAPYEYTETLYIGIKSDEVKMLQEELQGLGFFSKSVEPTGYFGPITDAAVRAFQAANGIEAIGIVGPKTRAALNTL